MNLFLFHLHLYCCQYPINVVSYCNRSLGYAWRALDGNLHSQNMCSLLLYYYNENDHIYPILYGFGLSCMLLILIFSEMERGGGATVYSWLFLWGANFITFMVDSCIRCHKNFHPWRINCLCDVCVYCSVHCTQGTGKHIQMWMTVVSKLYLPVFT